MQEKINSWAYQQTVKDDVEDQHPQLFVAHMKTCPQPDQGDEQEQVENQRNLWGQRVGKIKTYTYLFAGIRIKLYFVNAWNKSHLITWNNKVRFMTTCLSKYLLWHNSMNAKWIYKAEAVKLWVLGLMKRLL